ncbi:hypothetical protein AB0J83_38390 [Actinoplanes sp. NPDC049596]|uniref:hypothetical protein n=1 Tax=unclassified Actinoplanes TaxID=2626549 RepID=UPI00342FC804
MPNGSTTYVSGAARLRELAGTGRLAEHAARADDAERRVLTGAAYEIAYPIVFARLTRSLELSRGHQLCAKGVDRLAEGCVDGFHDDVEAVVQDLLTHCRTPVLNLDAWIAGRVRAATVDAHRRRRGERGALQRPRLPGWLSAGLGHDRWLTTLATQILIWVGVETTAGTQMWPLEAWAADRAASTDDWQTSSPATVAREIDVVLAAMQRRPDWYESYVERPLGRKRPPLAVVPDEAPPVTDPDASTESELRRLAGEAVAAINRRCGVGEDTRTVVVDVIRKVFGGTFTAGLERAPHATPDPLGGVTGALADAATVNKIVGTVRAIIADTRQPAEPTLPGGPRPDPV